MIVSCITTTFKEGKLQEISLYSNKQEVCIDMEDLHYLTQILKDELEQWRHENLD